MAGSNEPIDHIRRALGLGFDPTVTPIAHPTVEPEPLGFPFQPIPEADALDAALDEEVNGAHHAAIPSALNRKA